MTLAEARRMALALAGATEQPHHGMPSFRVRGKIFATVPDDAHLRVMVEPELARAAVETDPAAFAELWWGRKLAGVTVVLARAKRAQVADLLERAWGARAPRS